MADDSRTTIVQNIMDDRLYVFPLPAERRSLPPVSSLKGRMAGRTIMTRSSILISGSTSGGFRVGIG